MTIGAIGTSGARALETIQSITDAASTSASGVGQSCSRGDSISVSGRGAMLNKLKELQQKDPAKFKEAMSTIAAKLKDAAGAATDPKEQKALSDLSAKFAAAGQTGDLSGLAAPKHGKGGGGRHSDRPPAGGAAGAAASTSASDPADTNGDGTVSDAERQAYAAKQSSSSGAHAYQQGAGFEGHQKMSDAISKVSAIVDSVLGGITG